MKREALPAAQATLVSVCGGCAFLLGCAFRAHAMHFSSELMSSSLRGHDEFVHSGSPFDLIVSQLLPGVSVDFDTYKVSFDYVFEVLIETANLALALSELHTGRLSGCDHLPFYECGTANAVCAVSRESAC